MRQGDPKSRRLKLVCVDSQEMMGMFLAPRVEIDKDAVIAIREHRFPDLPDDYRVMAVEWDFSRQCWCICLSSEEWPEVLQGELIPTLEGEIRTILVDGTRYALKGGAEPGRVETWRDKESLL